MEITLRGERRDGDRRRLRFGPLLYGALCLATIALGGCGSIDRLPAVKIAQAQKSNLLDIPDARFYPHDTDRINAIALKASQRRAKSRNAARPLRFLVVSGGGDDGAFGAGLLVGWSERGDRPQFDVVTGVSTGALTAPFAFLGRDYDATLKHIYWDLRPGDIFVSRAIVTVLTTDGLADSAPLRQMIDGYVDATMMERLAAAYREGRLLLVLTTNLDQGRPAIWNIGAIAESGHPKARELIVDVLLASASIPAIFPPVMIDVNIDGQRLQEMHVDSVRVAPAFHVSVVVLSPTLRQPDTPPGSAVRTWRAYHSKRALCAPRGEHRAADGGDRQGGARDHDDVERRERHLSHVPDRATRRGRLQPDLDR